MANLSRTNVDAIVYRKLKGFTGFADKDQYQLIEASHSFVPIPDQAVIRVHPITPFGANLHFRDSLLRNGNLRDVERNSTLITVVLRGNVALGDTTDRVVHYGRLANIHAKQSQQGEELLITSRFDWHMWGDITRGSITVKDRFDAVTPTFVEVAGDLVFNPYVNGRVWPNRWDTEVAAGTHYVFVHPQSLRRSNFAQGPPSAAQLSAERVEFWELREVVRHLCWTLNPNQTHIQNPTEAELDAAFLAKTDLIKGVRIPRGLYLPEALHLLLEPLGWSIEVNYIDHPNINLSTRRIAFVERHQGSQKFLRMQDFGDSADNTQSNVRGFDIDMDITDGSTNNPVVEATPEFVESTITLVPAWADSLDTTNIEDLRMDSTAMLANQALARVWRDWVANETGEYNTIRTPNNAQLDLDAVLGASSHVERRRHLMPMITSRPDGTPLGKNRGLQLDITINGVEKDSAELKNGGSWQLLRDEIGIRFTGVLPPQEMYAAGVSGLTVKVTGVIQADKVFDAESTAAASLIEGNKPEHIDVRDRYIIRRVDSTSKHSAAVIADTIEHTEIDDTADLVSLADEFLEQWDHAKLRGTVLLEGVDWVNTIELGTSVKGLGNRNYGLEVTDIGKATQKYPVIIGVRYRYDSQETVLILDDYRSPVRRELGRRGNSRRSR